MNLQQCRILVATITCRTFSEVSMKLGISQPTVIFHLRNLEQEIGLAVYQKNFHHIVLTEAGRALVTFARKMVALQRSARQLMDDYRHMEIGKIRISSSHTPATYFLPRMLAQFLNIRPHVRIQLKVGTADRIIDRLHHYETDLGIISYMKTTAAHLTVTPLMADELVLILPSTHPLAKKTPLEIADLDHLPLITHEPGTTTRILTELWASENHFALHILMELGSTETIKESVRYGIGAGILPLLTVQREKEATGIIVRHLPNYTNHRFICLVRREDEPVDGLTENFINYIRRQIALGH